MKQGSQQTSGDILSEARIQFERWRKSRKRGTRIPEALWRAAVEAAGERGVSKTAQVLGLDYYALKKRLEAPLEVSEPESVGGREFLEIPLFASAPDCVLEMQDAQGARVRIELRGSAAVHCDTLVQALWSVVR